MSPHAPIHKAELPILNQPLKGNRILPFVILEDSQWSDDSVVWERASPKLPAVVLIHKCTCNLMLRPIFYFFSSSGRTCLTNSQQVAHFLMFTHFLKYICLDKEAGVTHLPPDALRTSAASHHHSYNDLPHFPEKPCLLPSPLSFSLSLPVLLSKTTLLQPKRFKIKIQLLFRKTKLRCIFSSSPLW